MPIGPQLYEVVKHIEVSWMENLAGLKSEQGIACRVKYGVDSKA